MGLEPLVVPNVSLDSSGGSTQTAPAGDQRQPDTDGRLVQPKDPVDTQRITDRILTMDVDVLAVQEMENIGILRQLSNEQLNGMYPITLSPRATILASSISG